MNAGERIPESLLKYSVGGVNLSPGTLQDQLGSDLVLLVFLRQFGCIFCRETLADMRCASEANEAFPRPLFFYQGTPTEGRAFLRRYWPGVRAIADPGAEFYEGFGLEQGSITQMFGPAVWLAQRSARAKGHRNGERSGDVWRMPGLILVRDTKVVWAHEYRHAADHPDYDRIAAISSELG